MKQFFDDYFNLSKMLQSKREYKKQMERVRALPADYRYVFEKVQGHMWQFAAGAGYDMMEVQIGLIDLFEEGAAEGKPVLEVTGEDGRRVCGGAFKEYENGRRRLEGQAEPRHSP